MSLSYFLGEGLIIIIIPLILSLFILIGADIIIQRYTGLDLFTGNILLIIVVVLLFSTLSLLSGILPQLKQGIKNLIASPENKKINYHGRKGISKTIIVLQYAISTALIIAVIVIARQTKFATDLSLGSKNENIICFENVHTDIQNKFEVFKEELLKYNSVRFVSAMLEPPGGEANDMFRFSMESYTGNETDKASYLIGIFPCDYSFADIFNLDFIGGNNFSQHNKDNEGSGEYIINESAMKRLNYSDPAEITGKEFRLLSGIEGVDIPAGRIIGVVRDFHLSGIKKKVEPLVLFKRDRLWLLNFVISFRPGSEEQALTDIQGVWTRLFPGYPFQYKYVRSMYRDIYWSELLQVKLLSVFTFTALFICSMGLLGLSLLMTRRRIKEIGLRKINGAGLSELVLMLNWDLLKWIILSFVIAIPFSFIVMKKWLGNFAYQTGLSWWIFILAGSVAVLIALLTISFQSWQAATRNPVDALRYE
jgi:putative ABC transport system permease protein